jgi:alkanesulfonate monooxygenase SsuD/methylene tetrahydromethanopterin reductase-like flavin-dependent oxidoreductase (luciferase family)
LAAKHGEPIFSSNTLHPQAKYKALTDHYRERLDYYKHEPNTAVVGSGFGCLYLANTPEEAIKRYRPYYDALHATASAQHNQSPFKNLEDNIKNGPALIGNAEIVIGKILNYHAAYEHQVINISVDGLNEVEQCEQVERFATEVAPVLRRELPSTPVWGSGTSPDNQGATVLAGTPYSRPEYR